MRLSRKGWQSQEWEWGRGRRSRAPFFSYILNISNSQVKKSCLCGEPLAVIPLSDSPSDSMIPTVKAGTPVRTVPDLLGLDVPQAPAHSRFNLSQDEKPWFTDV